MQIRREVKQITHFIDPRTGEEVPIDASTEHMRVNLLDPKWQEEKRRNLEKHKGSGLTTDENIAQNLSSLAKKRPDIFGGDEEAPEPKPVQRVR